MQATLPLIKEHIKKQNKKLNIPCSWCSNTYCSYKQIFISNFLTLTHASCSGYRGKPYRVRGAGYCVFQLGYRRNTKNA